MNLTVDIRVLALVVIGIALVVFIVYGIQLLRKLIVTIEHTNKILEDVEVVSEIAARRSKDVDGIIGDVSESVSEIAGAVKGKQSTFAAVSSLVKSLASLKDLMSKDEK